jgi:hypothetical protein
MWRTLANGLDEVGFRDGNERGDGLALAGTIPFVVEGGSGQSLFFPD